MHSDSTYIELTRETVGRPFIRAFGRTWPVSYFIGRIFPSDVGRRVYLVDGILQVESDRQRERREKRSLREASEIIERIQSYQHGDDARALIIAKQALDILATLEENLHLRESVSFSRTETVEGPKWAATRGPITHHGVSLSDALGQLCQVLAMENG